MWQCFDPSPDEHSRYKFIVQDANGKTCGVLSKHSGEVNKHGTPLAIMSQRLPCATLRKTCNQINKDWYLQRY